ncbi:MAG: VTT domain-containing protein [Acidobacteriales bacterium]|nr:VTT domain-containing protein [Terriglobales bacterium]
MSDPTAFLIQHGYVVIFAWVFLDQIGLPLPSLPILLAAGAMAGAGKLSFLGATSLAALAAFLCDAIWFEAGRHRGGSVLKLVCRASLEPDSCVRRTKDMFARYGNWPLLVSKFVPGLNAVASPLAGMSGMRRFDFLAWNALGSALFAGVLVGLGHLFSPQLEQVSALASRSGSWLLAGSGVAFGVYLSIKYVRRLRFLRMLRVGRISPEELKQRLDAGEEVVIVDLRHPLDFKAEPRTLPRALRLDPDEMPRRHHEIPRDREIVLYCTCPDERTSVRVALLLKRYGIHRVRPLAGGFNAWAGKGFLLASEERAEQAEPDLSVKEYSAKPQAVAVNGSSRIRDVEIGRGNRFTAGDDDGIVRTDD